MENVLIGQRLLVSAYNGKPRADYVEIVDRRALCTGTMLTVKLLNRPKLANGKDQFRNFYLRELTCTFVK